MRSGLSAAVVAALLSACIPAPGPSPRPRIPIEALKIAVYSPTEMKVFEEHRIDKRTLCRSGSGVASHAELRDSAALVGHDVFPEDGCPYDHVFHYWETGLRFGDLTSLIFPADITIHRATLRSKLKESYTRQKGFTKGWQAVLDECGAILVSPLLQDLRAVSAEGPNAGPRGTWVSYFPRTTSAGEVTFGDVTDAVRKIYSHRTPNFGFVLTHWRPPEPRFSGEIQRCVSLFENFELRVTYSEN